MSTSTVRRLKDRGGAGGKITASAASKPSRSITPVSERLISRSGGADSVKKLATTGKENPASISRSRPTSRIRVDAAVIQKPVMKPLPRIDKSMACGGGDIVDPPRRARWSTSSSSVPRGRSSSPSKFSRGSSRVSRVSIGEIDRNQPKKGSFRDFNSKESDSKFGFVRSAEIGKRSASKNEKGQIFKDRVPDEVNVSLMSLSASSLDSGAKGVDKLIGKSDVVDKLGSRECIGKSLDRPGGLDKEKGKSKGNVVALVGNEYASKLHEKLAFLEGKVKRIASDIKRTKEMLDLNNPDASKVILTDIQETVAGIEKEIGHVANNKDQKLGLDKASGSDNLLIDVMEKTESKQVDELKGLVKGLNTEELEARFFPHHKLLRDRTTLKASSRNHQTGESTIKEPTRDVNVKEKLVSSIDENPIALEFLASLSNDQSKVTSRGENASLEIYEVQETDDTVNSAGHNSSNIYNEKCSAEIMLTTNETLEDFDDQENTQDMIIEEEIEDSCTNQLNEIGRKTSTGGWFVSEGESVLLAHDDGSCSFYDIANCEEKTEYKPPNGVSPNMWQDCWILRAPGADGCSGRYVVAASAGNSMDSGFCSWDFYTKDVRAFHVEDEVSNTRTALAPLPNNTLYRRNTLSNVIAPESQQWWYKPCGPLIVSTSTCQKVVMVYDIRDGEHIMKWEVQKPVLAMDYSSPLQWRNRGKVVVAEAEGISLWDVGSQNPEALMTVSSFGRKISALHVNNTDAELGGGVRQRVSSSEAEGNDGVFCTADAINVLDFRHPSGIGLKIPKIGTSVQSVFSRGDSIFLGCSNLRSTTKKQSCSLVQQFSLRKQKLFSTYALPESSAHSHYTALTQVWGNSNLVMGLCGLGLFVFDALKDDAMQPFTPDYGNAQKVREVIGPDDLYSPSFDYLGSRSLLISRDRPAQWRYLS